MVRSLTYLKNSSQVWYIWQKRLRFSFRKYKSKSRLSLILLDLIKKRIELRQILRPVVISKWSDRVAMLWLRKLDEGSHFYHHWSHLLFYAIISSCQTAADIGLSKKSSLPRISVINLPVPCPPVSGTIVRERVVLLHSEISSHFSPHDL